MTRLAIVLALLLSAAVMMRGLASDWKKSPSSSPVETAAKKEAAPAPAPPASLQQGKALQPAVPAAMPDLKTGYLFNPERMLAGAEPLPPADDSGDAGAADGDVTPLISASMSEVTYVGSIITDAFSRAIIIYPAASEAAAQPASRSSKSKSKSAASSSGGKEEHARLEKGDELDGYKVAEILPDKLIFTKGEETVEKLLYDPEKKRQAPPPRPAAALPPGGGGARPQPAIMGGGATTPRGVMSTTIGGPAGPAAPAAPATPAPAATSGPAAPAVATPPALTPRPVSTSTATGSTASSQSSPQPPPVRRMVISREPPAPADTSRVFRRNSGMGDMMPTPPMPGGN